MRVLKNKVKVYGYDELTATAQKRAREYISRRKEELSYAGKSYNYTVTDFEWLSGGSVMFYTNNIDAY